jgi:hypothetical protein
MSAGLHQFGRAALVEAWPLVTGASASLPELQVAGAIADHESGYGTAAFLNAQTGERITNTNNWGAVQAGHGPPCGPGTFEATDSSPLKVTADNPKGQYQVCFLRLATPAEGAMAFVKQVTLRRPTVWDAMKAGDIDETVRAMHDDRPIYFEGFGATPAIQKEGYAAALAKIVPEIASAMGEPVLAARGGASGEDDTTGNLVAIGGGATLLYLAWRWWKGKRA